MTDILDGTPADAGVVGDNDDRKCLSARETDGTTEQVKQRNHRKTFVNIKLWVAFMTLNATFLATDAILRYAVLTTLEKRFGFTSVYNGVLVSAYDMGHVLALVVLSIVGHKVHRPRVCAVGGFLSTVSGLLFAMPHFLFGPGAPSRYFSHATNATVTASGITLCSPDIGSFVDSCDDHSTNVIRSGDDMATESIVAFAVLFLSQCLLGAGFAPFLTIAITYLDDNAEPAHSAVGVSLFLSVISLGPMMGFLLGAVTTSTFVDLSTPDMTPDDPRWVGAWWLGSLVLAVVIVFSSLPLMLFPRNLQTEAAVARHRRSRHLSLRSQGADLDAALHSRADKMRHMLQRRLSELSFTSVKEVPRRSGSLLLNVVFVCQTLTLCCFQYCMAGLLPFLPKYLETQFHVDTFVANIITSITIAFANAAGTFSGGVLAAERELGPRGLVRLIVVGLFLGSCCFIGTMFLGCPQSSLMGTLHDGAWNATGVCNANCACPSDFGPVCGSDNVTYLSACYAGCQSTVQAAGAAGLKTYGNCSCVGDFVTSGIAQSGWCSNECSTLVPYATLTFMAMFFVSLGASPMMVTLTRCVDQEKKSLSLGVANVLTSLLSSIPGPMLYGRLVDQTCVARERTCAGDNSAGVCIMYDNAAFRFYLHGLTNGAILLGMIFMSIAYLRLRKTTNFDGAGRTAERTTDTASPTEELPMTEVDPLTRH